MTGPRQNEYFIPGEGISREVIQADICRYLGNDALVRPGNHNVRLPFPFFPFSLVGPIVIAATTLDLLG